MMYLLVVCFELLSTMIKSMINAAMRIIDITHIEIQIRRRLNLFLNMIKVLANVIKLTLINSSSYFHVSGDTSERLEFIEIFDEAVIA